MHKILVLSASVRNGKKSSRVADYFLQYLRENNIGEASLLDLETYDFPIFQERLQFLENPSDELLDFSARIREADGIVLVTPEYNGGIPASLKNAIDVLYSDWHHKPIAIATVSAGGFGGTQVITSLLFTLWKMHAWVVPAHFPVPMIDKSFNEKGEPADKAATDKKASAFIAELTWAMEASKKMKDAVK